MNPLSLIGLLSPGAWLKVGAIAALAILVGLAVHHERDVGREEVQVQWAQERAKEQAAADAERQRNEYETARRETSIKEIQHDAALQVEHARADAAVAAGAADRLRQRFAATARGCATAPDPGSAASGPPTQPTSDVLADVFSRTLDVAQQLAAAADQSRAAGLACQRSYDSLTRSSP